MQNPIRLIADTDKLITCWSMFERWSSALTGAQFYSQGISGQSIGQTGGIGGDPILFMPNIPNNYRYLELHIQAKFATQQSNGAGLYPLTLTNSRCGYPGVGNVGFVVDGVLNQVSFPGEKGVLYLDTMPTSIDCTNLFVQYLIDSSYNNVTFPLAAPGSKYVSGAFLIELHGYN